MFIGGARGNLTSSTLELATGASAGTINNLSSNYAGFNSIVIDSGANWTFTNSGTRFNYNAFDGETLTVNGTLTNTGSIQGFGTAANVVDVAGRLNNSGRIGVSVTLTGGYLANTATGTISTNGTAVVGTGGAVDVANSGKVNQGSGASGVGIYLKAGGSVANTGAAAVISEFYGVEIAGAAGTVTNSGTIIGAGSGLTGVAVDLVDGGSIGNTGALAGGLAGALLSAGGTVNNSGAISGRGAGVSISGSGTVTNAGTISATSGDAVLFSGNGTDRVIVDPGAVFTGNVVGGSGGNTLELAAGSSGTLSFSNGTITGVAGTTFTNFANIVIDGGASWALLDGATIAAGDTLSGGGTLTVGTATNSASIGLDLTLNAGGYLDNTATGMVSVVGGSAVYSAAAGSVNNSGTISGGLGIKIVGGVGTVINLGKINGTGLDGVYLQQGGAVTNTGTAARIIGNSTGIMITNGAGTVSNSGVIKGGNHNIGVYFGAGDYNDTLTNAGTITGNLAVEFGNGGADRVIVDPGAVFQGGVAGGAGSNTLELASATSTGTINGIYSTNFVSFGTIDVDPGAKWDFASSDTLENSGTLKSAPAPRSAARSRSPAPAASSRSTGRRRRASCCLHSRSPICSRATRSTSPGSPTTRSTAPIMPAARWPSPRTATPTTSSCRASAPASSFTSRATGRAAPTSPRAMSRAIAAAR